MGKKNDVIQIGLIKLDLDRNVFGVLAGGKELLKLCQPIFLMEMVGPHFGNLERNLFYSLKP